MLRIQASEFVRHRFSKIYSVGRKRPRNDSSFHRNTFMLHTWMAQLEYAACKQYDPCFHGVSPIIRIVRTMLSESPHLRPDAVTVRDGIGDVLVQYCGIQKLHCDCGTKGAGNSRTVPSLRTCPTFSRLMSDSSSNLFAVGSPLPKQSEHSEPSVHKLFDQHTSAEFIRSFANCGLRIDPMDMYQSVESQSASASDLRNSMFNPNPTSLSASASVAKKGRFPDTLVRRSRDLMWPDEEIVVICFKKSGSIKTRWHLKKHYQQ